MIDRKDNQINVSKIGSDLFSEKEEQNTGSALETEQLNPKQSKKPYNSANFFDRGEKQKQENTKISVSPIFSSEASYPKSELHRESSTFVSSLKEKPPLWFIFLFVLMMVSFISINFLVINRIFFQNKLLPNEIYYQETNPLSEPDRNIDIEDGVLDDQQSIDNDQSLSKLSIQEREEELNKLTDVIDSIDVQNIEEKLSLLDKEMNFVPSL